MMVVTKPVGAWTYEDLLAMPDDGKQYELIDGELYEMPPPGERHQSISAQLIELFLPEVRRLSGRWYHAPTGVFLPNGRMLLPDILILLPGSRASVSKRGVEGAPDLVVEILSPSNPEHDRVVKRAWYAEAGVREYWLVSPEAALIEVLALEDGAYRTRVRAREGDQVTSTVLPGLSFRASAVFDK